MLLFKLSRSVIYNLRFSPDGRRLLTTASEPSLAVLDALTGAAAWTDRTSNFYHSCAAFTPDGRFVYDLGAAYPNPQRLHTRDADTGRDLGSIPVPGPAFAVTPDQKHLLYASARGLRSTDGADFIRAEPATGERLDSLHLAAPVREIVVSPDGRRAAVRGTELFALVDLERWAVLASQTLTMTNAVAYGTRFAPDGRTVVTSLGPHLRIWDAGRGRQLREVRDRGTHVQDIAFTPDGRFVLTVSNDATVKVRDTASWELVKSYTWKVGKLRAVDISPDGALAATGSATGKIVVWDLDL